VDELASPSTAVGDRIELVLGAPAAGGGMVARAPDGRIVFVRHGLPDERVTAVVTAVTANFLRADAVEVHEASPARVAPPCAYAGHRGCGGCDYQHVALDAQRTLKAALVAEQLRRVAGVAWRVEVEELPGAPDGLGWRTRVAFSADADGRVGLFRHRSHDLELIEACLIASAGVEALGIESLTWPMIKEIEAFAPADGGTALVAAHSTRRRAERVPRLSASVVVDAIVVSGRGSTHTEVLGHRYRISAGVFWQVHPEAPATLAAAVLAALAPRPGDNVADLYAGAGLFSAQLARAVGPHGSVLAVERDARACADAVHNTATLGNVEVLHRPVTATVLADHLASVSSVVLDPAREGAGREVMTALVTTAHLTRLVYVACEPSSFARDLKVALDHGWTMTGLRSFDLFPMTEHVELVATLEPPAA
jgi:tRNA/tmRNA/rRNA uracil-C5-methylase (TrmA/RlmC/RlmD family)